MANVERPPIRVDRLVSNAGSGAVAEVVLDRAEKRNAMGPAFWGLCRETFEALSRDDTVRAVLVRGEGPAFSAGLDLAAFATQAVGFFGGTAKPRTAILRFIEEAQAAFTAIDRCRKPVVAAIHGACVGGGLDLVAACCIRLAAKDARFSLREAKIGIVADLGSLQRLPRAIGFSATRELAYTARDLDADRALRLGLVSEVYDTPEALLTAARALAAEIAANPPLVVQGIKSVMQAGEGLSIEAALHHTAVWNAAFLESDDLQEAMAAYLEKRPPVFHGR